MSNLNKKLANLSEEKRKLLLKHLEQKREESKKTIVAQPRTKQYYSLSLRQQRLFILDQLDPGNPFYNIPACLHLKGALDIDKLEQALNAIVEKHYSLRTTFYIDENNTPFQQVHEHTPFKLEVIDYKKLHRSKDEIITEIVQTSFHLTEGPLWRISLLKESDQEHQLIVSFHHILFDGWSLEVFIKELCSFYQDAISEVESMSKPLRIQYVDYAEWELNYFDNKMRQEQLAYWEKELQGCQDILSLPTDKSRPKVQSFKGNLYTIDLPQEVHLKLRKVCQTHETTLFMVTLAAFQTLLSRYANQDDVIVGFPISCRDQEEIESLIGLFVNTLPLRANLSDNPTFVQLLKQVKEKSLEAFNNKHVPFDQIVEHLQPSRDLSFNPIFQVLFSYQSAILPIQMDGLSVEFENVDPGTSKFDLSLDIFEGTEEIPPKLVFEYNTDLFYEETIITFAKQYIHLLLQVAEDPNQRTGEFALLSEEEQREKVNIVSCDDKYVLENSIVTLFEQKAQQCKNDIAIAHRNQSFTYEEINQRANALARYLQQRGARADDTIGICLDKSVDMVVSLLAVLKVGAAYIPIDPQYPSSRIAFMIEDSKIKLVISKGNQLEEHPSLEMIHLDQAEKELEQLSNTNLTLSIHPEQLAYIIYTSGTTGNPKGVMVSHANLVNSFYGWEEAYQLSDKTTSHLQMASFSFDVCTGDIVRTLLSGSKLVLCDKDVLLDPEKLYQLIIKEKVDFAEFIPVVFRQLAHYLEETGQKLAMHCVVLGSDTWYMKEYEHFLTLLDGDTRLINSYGLTEDTIDTSFFEWNKQELPSKAVPIGKPLLNKQIIILDTHQNVVPTGVVGEIYIAGKGITKGYLNRPELTDERFIPNPFDGGKTKLYKTGDLGRYLRDGNVELIGRADDQVKIRGFRIELSEVNSVLLKHPQIKESIVVDVELGSSKQLVAYYVGKNEISSEQLKGYLKDFLPEYMIPTQWMPLDKLPLNSNRKIDKKALPKPDLIESSISSYVGARTLVESMVQNIWEEAFQRPRIGIHEDFFELGGHSLLAIQIMNRIQESFSVQLPIQALFQSPSIYEISKLIESKRENEKENHLEIPLVEPDFENRYQPFPLTDIQQAYWIGRSDVFEFGNVSTHSYDEMKAEELDINQFEYAWNTMIQRHEMLRAVINEDGTQQILQEVPYYSIKIYDLEHANTDEVEEKLKEIRHEMAHQLLPATTWPTFDVRISKLPDQTRIHFSTDALFWDAWSFVTLIKELVMVYQNQEDLLRPLEFSFRDYVLAEQQIKDTESYKRAKEYWKKKVALLPPAPELPVAKNPAAIKQPTFTRLHRALSQETWSRLKRKATKNGLTPTALLLSVYAEILSVYSKNPSFSLNLTFLNRHHVHPQVNEVVGEFTSVMLLSVDNQAESTFIERTKKIQIELWNDIEHNYISGVEILREMTRIQGAATQAKMPVVFTSALVVPVPDQEEAPIPFRPVNEDGVTQTSQVWLDCGVWEDTKQLMCNWDVVLEMYPEGLVQEMFDAFCGLIQNLADEDSLWKETVLPILPDKQIIERKQLNATDKEVLVLSQ